MKKLMIGAFAMALGLAAQAGSFNWTYASSKTEYEAGYHVYVILGATADTTKWESAASIPSVSDAAVKKVTTKYKASGTADSSSITSYDQQAIFVLVNGDQYKITEAITLGDSYVMIGQDNDKDTYSVAFSGDWTKFGGSGDVPEPTSAMLLLIGVAGLALRRKQA